MAGYNKTSAVIDGILKLLVVGGSISTVLVAPNILQMLNKPVSKFFKAMDKREQERELQRILYYMKDQGLVSGSYDHGLKISNKGRKRLERVALEAIAIAKPRRWDRKWRLVFYDIPERSKIGRHALLGKLKGLGFYQLQRSVLVHPYPCREEVVAVSAAYGINQYVSYIETDHIDQQKLLISKFRRSLPKTYQ